MDSSTYQLVFTPDEWQSFPTSCRERSVIDTGIAPSAADRILTLSTCTGTGYTHHWAVHARLTE